MTLFLFLLVGAGGLEPPTPTVSRWCSTAELRANAKDHSSGSWAGVEGSDCNGWF